MDKARHLRIRGLRKQRGMTLKQVADAIGTTPQTVQRLETANAAAAQARAGDRPMF